MGCKAFTPSLVGLASELKDEPFHLIASFNQRGDAKIALHELFQNGLDVSMGNVSGALSTRHPKVTGITYVPYYLVFDQHGDLIDHHQGGPYHGGDGTAVLDRIKKRLKTLPKVYVGKEPYKKRAALAKQIAKGKGLKAHFKKLDSLLRMSPQDKELLRLKDAAERYAQAAMARFDQRAPLELKKAVTQLSMAAKDFRRLKIGKALVKKADQAVARKQRAELAAADKDFAKILQRWRKLKTIRGNKSDVINPTDPSFRETNKKSVAKLKTALNAYIKAHKSKVSTSLAETMLQTLS